MVAAKLAAAAPHRVGSLTLLGYAQNGWQMAASLISRPDWLAQVEILALWAISAHPCWPSCMSNPVSNHLICALHPLQNSPPRFCPPQVLIGTRGSKLRATLPFYFTRRFLEVPHHHQTPQRCQGQTPDVEAPEEHPAPPTAAQQAAYAAPHCRGSDDPSASDSSSAGDAPSSQSATARHLEGEIITLSCRDLLHVSASAAQYSAAALCPVWRNTSQIRKGRLAMGMPPIAYDACVSCSAAGAAAAAAVQHRNSRRRHPAAGDAASRGRATGGGKHSGWRQRRLRAVVSCQPRGSGGSGPGHATEEPFSGLPVPLVRHSRPAADTLPFCLWSWSCFFS